MPMLQSIHPPRSTKPFQYWSQWNRTRAVGMLCHFGVIVYAADERAGQSCHCGTNSGNVVDCCCLCLSCLVALSISLVVFAVLDQVADVRALRQAAKCTRREWTLWSSTVHANWGPEELITRISSFASAYQYCRLRNVSLNTTRGLLPSINAICQQQGKRDQQSMERRTDKIS